MQLVLAGVWVDVLPWAIAIALTPIAVTAVVMFLGSERGLAKSLALLVGDAATMTVIAVLAVAFFGGAGFAEDGTPPREILVLELIAGLVLVGISAWGIRRRLGVAFFVLVATSIVWGPIAIYVAAPKRADDVLGRLKIWIGLNGVLVLDCILLLIGLNLTAAAIAGLA